MPTEQEEFYLKTISDLERRMRDRDPFEILGSSVLIRKLFLDDDPLVDQINRNYKFGITFYVIRPTPIDSDEYAILDDLDTSRFGKVPTGLTRDEFFKIIVLRIKGKEYTIRDVILFEANIIGAFHYGMEQSEKDKILKILDDQMSFGGYPSSLLQLKAIGRVVLKALDTLTQYIRQKRN